MQSELIQKCLLTKPDTLIFAQTVEVAEGMEATKAETQKWRADVLPSANTVVHCVTENCKAEPY